MLKLHFTTTDVGIVYMWIKAYYFCKIVLLEKHGCYTLQEVKLFSSFKSINSICSSYKVVMSILKIKPLFIWVRFTIFYEFLSIKVVVAYLSKIFFFVLKVNKSYRCWTHEGEQWQHLWVNYPFWTPIWPTLSKPWLLIECELWLVF